MPLPLVPAPRSANVDADPPKGPTMAAQSQPKPTGVTPYVKGEGWLTFAAILVFIGGVLNVIWGIAAVDAAKFFAGDAQYVISDLNVWGWVTIVLGGGLMVASAGIFSRNRLAIWAGVVFVAVDAIAQLLSIDAYPYWSLAVFALDVLALYGLLVYGVKR
jgi:hypothetical protein